MTDGEEAVESSTWRRRFRDRKTVGLLGDAEFRRLYLGGMVSRIGDKLYFVAAMWLVYELTGSTVYTGLAGFLTRLPQVASAAFGPLVDRARLGRLLVLVEAAQGAIVLAVPVAAFLGRLNVFVVLAVVPVLALLRRITAPAEQAAFVRLVDDDLLARGNSLWSATEQTLGAVSEAVSGTLIAVIGAVALFALNGATFAVSTFLFGLLQIPPTEVSGTSVTAREYVADLRQGFDVIRRSVLGHMVVAASLAGVFTGMSTAVLPAFADAFGGAGAFGLLVAATTVGTLLGSLLAAHFETVRMSRVAVVGFVIAAVGRVGAVVVEPPPVILALYGAAAIPLGVYNVLASTVVQSGVPNDLLARVSSTVGSFTAVLGPLGFLVGGYLGGVAGSAATIGLSAVGFLVVALYWLFHPSLREFPPVERLESGSFDVRTDG